MTDLGLVIRLTQQAAGNEPSGIQPGTGARCSGISEDVEFARRVIKNGMRIGFEPMAGVIHEVDRRRLSKEFIRQRPEQQGRSRLIYKG